MTTFAIDTEYARRLSHELFQASQGSNPPPPPLPGDSSLAHFSQSLHAALLNVGTRTDRLRGDLDHLARFGLRMAHEAETTESAHSAALGGRG